MPDPTIDVLLPGGVWCGGTHHCTVALRPLTGRDEMSIAESAEALFADRVNALLARCVSTSDASLTPDALVGLLPLGDREALLLRLHGLTYGPRIDAVARCPECGAHMDLDVTTDQLLLAPYPDAGPEYELHRGPYRLRFRVPTSADQAVVAGLSDVEGATELLRRCVLQVSHNGDVLHGPPPQLVAPLEDAMQERDPQAELALELVCPECGEASTTVLDAAGQLLHAISVHADRLYAQIHVLALSYHWSEAEILSLPPARRMRYLDMLDSPTTAGVPR